MSCSSSSSFVLRLLPVTLLVGSIAAMLPAGPAAAAPVGVTAASDGDPLGKPPAEVERVLRVGVDIQAAELVTTGTSDRAQLLFLDGTSLTVGPNAVLRIDRFVYDPSSSTGELGVTLGKGVLRMVGGKISKTRPVVVNTPGGSTGIRGGIALIDAQPSQTTSTFMFGRDMTVTGRGVTQTVTRPGYEVTLRANMPPAPPLPISEQALNAQIAQLEGRRSGSGGTVPGGQATVVKVTQGLQNVAAQQPAPAPAPQPAPPAQPPGWQQWGGGVAYQNPSAVNPAISGGTTLLVAGQVPTFSQLPTTGTATYNGSFSVTQSSSGPFGGSINMGWNFASQSGVFSATANGQNGNTGSASGPVTLLPGTAKFSGTLANGSIGSTIVTVNGNFVTTSTSPVGAISGTMTGRNGQQQVGSGTFSGTK